jgi:Kef-type K+ transport system membrane component KefB
MDDVAIWGVLALILMDWHRVGKQVASWSALRCAAWAFRRLMLRLPERDRWYVGLIWLALCGLGADWSGLHFMVGAFLSGAVMDRQWFDQKQLDMLRQNVLLVMMPVFFLSTGLRTNWSMGGPAVLLAAGRAADRIGQRQTGGHAAGREASFAGRPGESSLIGWLLQTKALIMIIFANVLLDKGIITSATFTALLLMAVASTMLTIPMATPKLRQTDNGGLLGAISTYLIFPFVKRALLKRSPDE